MRGMVSLEAMMAAHEARVLEQEESAGHEFDGVGPHIVQSLTEVPRERVSRSGRWREARREWRQRWAA